MDSELRKCLEEAGYKFGDAEDFLELTDEERQHVQKGLDQARRREFAVNPPNVDRDLDKIITNDD